MEKREELIDRLAEKRHLEKEEWVALLTKPGGETREYAAAKAREVREIHYGRSVYIRGLIEISNYCKNNCLYCGIRCGNRLAARYRLTPEQVLDCCRRGYGLGFRTFVLQGGEDPHFTDSMIIDLVRQIKGEFPECAVTLSIGEKEESVYQAFRDAGADRYLLRHETALAEHYAQLHPATMSHAHRIACIRTLKRLGFQTGTGFMVGSPFQTAENLAADLLLLEELQPEMVGIGPFIPHHQTPFATQPGGSIEQTLFLLSLIRLLLPSALLPSTTALGTLDPVHGRQSGILAGANVVMPNLSPADARDKYMIYDNKNTATETVDFLDQLRAEMLEIGYEVVVDRGDFAKNIVPLQPLS